MNLPLLAGFLLSDHFSIEMGPEFGYLLNRAANKGSYRDTKKIDLSGSGGFSLRLNDKIIVGVRYTQGLINVDQLVITGMPPFAQPERRGLGKNQALHVNLLISLKGISTSFPF